MAIEKYRKSNVCNHSIFTDIPEVTLLEKREKWFEACKRLYQMWKEDVSNLEVTLRTLWECWYLEVEDLCFVNFSDEEVEEVRRIFQEVYRYGEQHFRDEGKYQWLTGYMLGVCGSLMYEITVYREELKFPGIHILDLADREAAFRLKSASKVMPSEIMWKYENGNTLSEDEKTWRRKLFTKKKLTEKEEWEKQKLESEKKRINEKIKEYFSNDSLIDQYFLEMYRVEDYDFC